MDYDYTSAQFYMLFPYYLSYKAYRCHVPFPLSDKDMQASITKHLASIHNTREKDLEVWSDALNALVVSGVHLSKLNTHIEQGKLNKYEVPEPIREKIEKSLKVGKELRKIAATKLPIDKLIQKRDQLSQFKIITNEMTQYIQTVARCEDWIRKQQKFEATYFLHHTLLPQERKIQFKQIQLLCSQFNNLPLLYDGFEQTTLQLYNYTTDILERMPALNKIARTRTAQSSSNQKISVEVIKQYQHEIDLCPIQHEQFIGFQCHFSESLEWIQRIGMFLEDQRTEKTLKLLGHYSKILVDNPIQNSIQGKLQARLEYYEIMEKIKKDILNPSKYEQVKEGIKRLKEKGFDPLEYSKIENKFVAYIEWHESHSILQQSRVIEDYESLINAESMMNHHMVKIDDFLAQFQQADQQMLISEEMRVENQSFFRKQTELEEEIKDTLNNPQTDLRYLIKIVKECIKLGFIFTSFLTAYTIATESLKLLAKMRFLQGIGEDKRCENGSLFLTDQQIVYLLEQMYGEGYAVIRDKYRNKEMADQVIRAISNNPFINKMVEAKEFFEFIAHTEVWMSKTIGFITKFKQGGQGFDIKEVVEEAKNCLSSKELIEELHRIDLAVKWREKISKKLNEIKQYPFDADDDEFMGLLETVLIQLQSVTESDVNMREKALKYLFEYKQPLNYMLHKMAKMQIDAPLKISDINKFVKEVDKQLQKYKLQDKIINELMTRLNFQLTQSEEWKERYLTLKRFEKKHISPKEQQEGNMLQEQEQQLQPVKMPYIPILCRNDYPSNTRRKYYIRNGQFCWYFKSILILFEFYNGVKLRFFVEELIKLKSLLQQYSKFSHHYLAQVKKGHWTDVQLQNLVDQGSKMPFFTRQMYILKKRNAYVCAWKHIATSIIDSVPILKLELKVRKPQQLIEILQKQRQQRAQQNKHEQKSQQILATKRKRKQNSYYNNEQMSIITDDMFGSKSKKKRKNADGQYRNATVVSKAKKQAHSQQEEQELFQALLKGDIPPQLIKIDDPKQYCICRYGVPNENSVMVECDKCNEWFHIECLSINPKKHNSSYEGVFKCEGCCSLYNMDTVGSSFIWHTHAKITENALVEVMEEGEHLGVYTPQLKKIQVIYKRMVAWKRNVKNIVKKISTAVQPIQYYEAGLYELYLHSLWFPTALEETKIVKRLLLFALNKV